MTQYKLDEQRLVTPGVKKKNVNETNGMPPILVHNV